MSENQDLPLYKRVERVQALQILSAKPAGDTWGDPWNLTFQNAAPIEVSHQFMQGQQPQAGGYYVIKPGMTPSYMGKEDFEKMYVKDE